MDTRERAALHPDRPTTIETPQSSSSITARPTIIIWPRTSKLTTCGTCREQLHPDGWAARMRLFEEAAHRFHETKLGKPYVEFKGGAA